MKPTVRSDCTPVSVASLWLQPGSVRQKTSTRQGLLQVFPMRKPPSTNILRLGNQGLTRTKLAEWVRQHPALGWWLKGHPKAEHPPPRASSSSGQWGRNPDCAALCTPPVGKQLEFLRQLCSRLIGLLFLLMLKIYSENESLVKLFCSQPGLPQSVEAQNQSCLNQMRQQEPREQGKPF